MTMEPLTRAELREELDRSLRHYATKADLANLKFTLAAWMLLLVSAATGILIAVDRLAGPGADPQESLRPQGKAKPGWAWCRTTPVT